MCVCVCCVVLCVLTLFYRVHAHCYINQCFEIICKNRHQFRTTEVLSGSVNVWLDWLVYSLLFDGRDVEFTEKKNRWGGNLPC